mgnify:CR=1 FL=1
MKKITIAIDGFSSCGKSTMAKDLAREIGYIYIDSGAMYRAVTLYSIENGIFQGNDIDTERLRKEIDNIHISFQLNPETGRPDTYLNGVNVENKIRSMEVSSHVSPIATLGFVRAAMVAQQQAMGNSKGIVMDGRDIGTTVFPEREEDGVSHFSLQIERNSDRYPDKRRPHRNHGKDKDEEREQCFIRNTADEKADIGEERLAKSGTENPEYDRACRIDKD